MNNLNLTSLSLCMIVRNEAQNLRACLESVKGITSELIIVDTGSNDSTIKIAQDFGAQVFEFPWQNNFALARNFALQQSQSEWILSLDGDDCLAPDAKIQIQQCLPQWNSKELKVHNFLALIPGKKPMFTRGIFPNLPGVRFHGRVHEYLSFKGKALPHEFHAQIKIHCSVLTPQLAKAKQSKYLPLILQELEETRPGEEAYQHYIWHLALCYEALNKYPEAYGVWRQIWKIYQDESENELMAVSSQASLEKLLRHLIPLMLQYESSKTLRLQIPEWFVKKLPHSPFSQHALAHVCGLNGDYQRVYDLCYEALKKLPMTEPMQAEFGKMAAWAKAKLGQKDI